MQIENIPKDNITSLLIDTGSEFNQLCEQHIEVTEDSFAVEFMVDVPPESRLRWYALRSRKVKIIIDKIICDTSNGEYLVDESTIIYNESEETDSVYKDMLTFDPCIDFTTPNKSVHRVAIKGRWITEVNYDELIRTYYRKQGLLVKQMEDNIAKATLEKNNYINELKAEIHTRDNQLKAAAKKAEKQEIHIELLKKDIEEIGMKLNTLEEGEKNNKTKERKKQSFF